MDSTLEDEITSINAIYGPTTLTPASTSATAPTSSSSNPPQTHTLHLPSHALSLRLSFPQNYPDQAPKILGPESTPSDPSSRKGLATEVVDVAREVLNRCFRPGEPCIFDLLEELRAREEEATATAFSTDDEGLSDVGSEAEEKAPALKQAMLKTASGRLFNAFIRTHHVTSRKKVGRVKKNAHGSIPYLLIRSGGSPGLMYAEGGEEELDEWIAAVQGLRYKDYHLVRRPAPVVRVGVGENVAGMGEGFEEVESVAGFAARLGTRGVLEWWRVAMGYNDGGG